MDNNIGIFQLFMLCFSVSASFKISMRPITIYHWQYETEKENEVQFRKLIIFSVFPVSFRLYSFPKMPSKTPQP